MHFYKQRHLQQQHQIKLNIIEQNPLPFYMFYNRILLEESDQLNSVHSIIQH